MGPGGVLAYIKSIVDLIKPETDKIDSAETDGLLGVHDSLSYRAEEIERHLHNLEKWFGIATIPDGEIHVADRMVGGIQPFILEAGDDDFGDWIQILGSADTPVIGDQVKFDAHRFMVMSTNSTNPYIIQVVSGESADIDSKIAAEEFTEAAYISASNNNDSGISEIMARRTDSAKKVWARCACIGSNGSTISMYFGIHEYNG